MIRKIFKKTMLRTAVFLLTIMVVLVSCSDKDQIVPEGDLPTSARSYIQTHFPNISISQVWRDKDGSRTSYEVTLVNGAYLEFNKSGAITQLESYAGLPVSTIPQPIVDFVSANYRDQKIVEWELDDNREQSVTLISRLELVFDLGGNFKRIDR